MHFKISFLIPFLLFAEWKDICLLIYEHFQIKIRQTTLHKREVRGQC